MDCKRGRPRIAGRALLQRTGIRYSATKHEEDDDETYTDGDNKTLPMAEKTMTHTEHVHLHCKERGRSQEKLLVECDWEFAVVLLFCSRITFSHLWRSNKLRQAWSDRPQKQRQSGRSLFFPWRSAGSVTDHAFPFLRFLGEVSPCLFEGRDFLIPVEEKLSQNKTPEKLDSLRWSFSS